MTGEYHAPAWPYKAGNEPDTQAFKNYTNWLAVERKKIQEKEEMKATFPEDKEN